jgi:hypothetical protein
MLWLVDHAPNRLAAKSLPAKGASLRTQQGRGLDKRQARRPQQRPQGHRSWLKWVRDFVIGLAICGGLVSWWIGQRHPEPPRPNNPADLRDLAATLPPPAILGRRSPVLTPTTVIRQPAAFSHPGYCGHRHPLFGSGGGGGQPAL